MTEHPIAIALRNHLADVAGPQPLQAAVLALRTVLIGFLDPSFAAAPSKADLADVVWAAADAIAQAAEPQLEAEAVRLGFGAAAGLLAQIGLPADKREPPDLLLARLDRVALVADEIDAVFRRRRLAAHGDPFARMIAVRRAQDAQPALGTPLN